MNQLRRIGRIGRVVYRARIARIARIIPINHITQLIQIAAWSLCIALVQTGVAHAETTVPVDLQIDLLRKIVKFERGFSGRVGGQVKVVVVVGGSDGERTASQLGKALENVPDFAGKPAKVIVYKYTAAPALKSLVASEGAQVVYLTPGLEAELATIASVFEGVPTITVTTDGDQVEKGAVLGFELASARPKIVLNLAQAKKQGLDFSSDLFRLARLIR